MVYHLTSNFKKCMFGLEEANFLGHVITPLGIKRQPEKIHIIKKFKRPLNVKQLQSFIGFINFYSKFAYRYSEITAPLYKLLKKGSKYVWTDEQETAFETIKDKFQKDMILAHPDPHKGYILYTDSSNYAVLGALAQVDDNNEEKIITFGSRTLKGSEILYFASEKELKYSDSLVFEKIKNIFNQRQNFNKNRSSPTDIFKIL